MAGSMSQKNLMLSPAASSLALGDQLKQQTEDEVAARKRKLSSLANGLSPATISLLGDMSNG